jgi:hypothetical protein
MKVLKSHLSCLDVVYIQQVIYKDLPIKYSQRWLETLEYRSYLRSDQYNMTDNHTTTFKSDTVALISQI